MGAPPQPARRARAVYVHRAARAESAPLRRCHLHCPPRPPPRRFYPSLPPGSGALGVGGDGGACVACGAGGWAWWAVEVAAAQWRALGAGGDSGTYTARARRAGGGGAPTLVY